MFQRIQQRLAEYHVVLEPDRNAPEWWAGAPSVARGPDGTFYLACRMREGESPRGRRGYEIRILRSDDGVRFEPIHSITREAAGAAGFERPALVWDPASERFRLYGCTPLERGWAILRWADAADPAQFEAAAHEVVLRAEYPDDGFARVTGYKDPVVRFDGERWHLFVIACDVVERIGHFVSEDGQAWRAAHPPRLLEHGGWHNFYLRPASVLPMAVGYLFVYEGSHIDWRDPVYNIATGLAYSPDLHHAFDLTPDTPLLKSTTWGDYHTWRYSHWLRAGDEIYVYFEAARPNNTNEIRVSVLDADDVR